MNIEEIHVAHPKNVLITLQYPKISISGVNKVNQIDK